MNIPETLPLGPFALDGGALFSVVPRTLWGKLYEVDDENRILLGLNSVLVRGNGRIVVIDAGTPEARPRLIDALQTRGIRPFEVTDLVLTHLHYDHCGGAFSRSDSGQVVPVFPKATIHVTRQELSDALTPDERTEHFYRQEIASFISRTGMANLIDKAVLLADDIELMPAPGHTLGHMVVWIYRDRQYLVPGDLIPTTHHLRYHYMTSFDENTRQNLDSKKKVLSRAANRPTTIFFYHDRAVPSAEVVKKDNRHLIR